MRPDGGYDAGADLAPHQRPGTTARQFEKEVEAMRQLVAASFKPVLKVWTMLRVVVTVLVP